MIKSTAKNMRGKEFIAPLRLNKHTMKIHNFSAGPSILPQPVLKQAAAAVQEFADMGLSILEISHRSKQFSAVMEEAEALMRELLGIDDRYSVLFLTGGASTQFFMTAMNLLPQGKKAAYINTGTWSTKAIKEVATFGQADVIASSEDRNFSYIPNGYTVPSDAEYLHITTNNTIFGTQFHELPDASCPIVADMSSDILSRPITLDRYGLIYAGAQKNLGPAGTTIVIVRNDLLGKVDRNIPTMLDYRTHIKKASAFNTPPAYPIYVAMLNMRWVKEQGGVAEMERRSIAKADLLYKTIETLPAFECAAEQGSHSYMNATFRLTDASREVDFLAACDQAGISGIKGHRSVGGFRASMYNALPLSSVQHLVDVMNAF